MYQTVKKFAHTIIFAGIASIMAVVLYTLSPSQGTAQLSSGHDAFSLMIVSTLGAWLFRQWQARLGPLRASAEDEWSAKSFAPNPAMARVYVFRDEDYAPLSGIEVRVDDVALGETYGKTFFQFELPPGEHLVTGMDRTSGSRADLMLRVEAGRLYFVKQVVWCLGQKSSHGFIILCEPVAAQSAVRHCRMMMVR